MLIEKEVNNEDIEGIEPSTFYLEYIWYYLHERQVRGVFQGDRKSVV